ncbi:MAG: hypothetical protein GX750_02370 [Clostridia bacterium]|nr:hypothetical protein [Clostridia bacterium]
MSYSVINRVNWRLLFLVAVLVFCFAPLAYASSGSQSNEQCMMCHGNPEFSIEQDGKTKSLYVDQDALANSVHGFSACTSCHPGSDALPHPETVKMDRTKIADSCSTCHAGVVEEYKLSLHSKGIATCTDCHGGGHAIQKESQLPISQQLQNHVETCGKCHQGRVLQSYQDSFHGIGVYLGGTNVPSCVTCHGAHAALGSDDPASPVATANVPQTCSTCHEGSPANMAAGTEHFLLEKEGPGKPMFYTFKFFTWLTIITITLLIIHIELELFRRFRDSKRHG